MRALFLALVLANLAFFAWSRYGAPGDAVDAAPLARQIEPGRLKIIAQTTAKRAPSLPEVPTYQEQGLAIELDQWLGFLVPTGTPADVVKRLNAATAKVLALPAVQERFAPQGLEVASGSPEEFAKLYKNDYDKYARLVKELGIRVD